MPRKWVISLIVFCALLNGAGFMWGIFEPIPLYDEVAHTLTPFTLVALTAEIIYRSGGDDDFFNTPRHAVITGAVIGLVGAIGWEGIEIVLDSVGVQVSHAPVDTGTDVLLGVLGGAAGAYVADRYLDRLFGVSRTNAQVQAQHRRKRRVL